MRKISFHFLVVINDAGLNTSVPVFGNVCFHFFWVDTYDSMAKKGNLMFSFSRSFHLVSASSCTILYSPGQYVRIPFLIEIQDNNGKMS